VEVNCELEKITTQVQTWSFHSNCIWTRNEIDLSI